MKGAERETMRNARNALARQLAYAPAAHRDALELGDLATADGTDTLDNTARITVVDDGTVVASRRRINFASTTLTFTIADDPPNERVNITVEGADGLPAGSTGDLLYYDGSSWRGLAAGSEGQVLRVGASGLPEWADS